MSAPRSKKVSAQRVQTSLRGRFNPIKGLTPEKLGAWLEGLDRGELRGFAQVADKIRRRDPQIASVTAKRSRAVALLDYEILTTEKSPAAEAQKEALAFLYNHIRVGHALDGNQSGGFSLLVSQMMRAVGDKYACHEIVWEPLATTADGPRIKAELVYIPLWFFENTTGRLRFLADEFSLYGRDLEEDGWLVTVGEGLMEATAVAYIFKNLTLKDWVYYSEKFGFPGVHGKTDAAFGSDDWNRFVEAVQSFGNDFSVVTNLTGEIKELSFGAKGELPFPKLCDYMDRALAILWRGGDLSTMSAGDSTGSNAQEEETEAIAEADAKMISETLNEQIDRPALRHLFGDADPLAYISIRPKTRTDVAQERSTDEFLIGAGVPIATDDLAKRYQRSPAASGAALAHTSAKPTLPFANERRALPLALQEESRRRIAAALDKQLAPVRERIQKAMAAGSDSDMKAALTELKSELPRHAKSLGADSALVKAYADAIGTALVLGAANAAEAKQ